MGNFKGQKKKFEAFLTFWPLHGPFDVEVFRKKKKRKEKKRNTEKIGKTTLHLINSRGFFNYFCEIPHFRGVKW